MAKLQGDGNVTTPFQNEPTVTSAMRLGILRAQRQRIRLIVANIPMTRARTDLEQAYGYEPYMRWIQGLCLEEGVPFVDLNQPPLLPADRDFADTHHLSARGAEHFSRLFTRQVILPALRDSQRKARP